jgi:hypothetical protein
MNSPRLLVVNGKPLRGLGGWRDLRGLLGLGGWCDLRGLLGLDGLRGLRGGVRP